MSISSPEHGAQGFMACSPIVVSLLSNFVYRENLVGIYLGSDLIMILKLSRPTGYIIE